MKCSNYDEGCRSCDLHSAYYILFQEHIEQHCTYDPRSCSELKGHREEKLEQRVQIQPN
jgi:hypothetical protein